MSAGWFKLGLRCHWAPAEGERSLCGSHVAASHLHPDPPVRPCARCSRLLVAADVERDHAAYLATLAPAQPVTMRPLTDAEKADAASLADVIRERGGR